jgi:single-strand DNA-binding protein
MRKAAASKATTAEPLSSAAGESCHTGPPHRNEVTVIGRLTTAALSRQLPSGDCLMTWRLTVDRPAPAKRREGRGQDYDVIDCTAWSARVRQAAARWEVGDVIEVRGALRRRFWRANAALQSRCELEAAAVSRQARAASSVTRRRKTG